MKLLLRIVLVLVVAVALLATGVYAWASASSSRTLNRTIEVHEVDFPIPFPLEADEIAELGLSPAEAEALAHERAVERGRHLVHARYPCGDCHGDDYGGGVMVDAFPIGTLLGPNLTSGRGSVVLDYTPADWSRIVRHGVRKDGRPAVMPSEDFLRMSDQELSDIVAYIESLPPVDNELRAVKLGPLGRILMATGEIKLSVDLIESHDAPHPVYPPPTEVSVEFGQHLGGVCVGCHGMEMTGGKIAGGDPAWVPASNLTPHAEGLAGWSYEDFVAAMRDARRPDGSEIRVPMTFVQPYAQQMTEVEMQALWTYLQSLPPQPTPR